ncbi:ADP-ribosylglycohydrolase family protein [Streptomyces sp. ALI-76-A]|jgi:ADP-ribosylglycohydrolase|uniref:ADP-ribosylglycohydrolase family protein n=1 Tax=Streptomyces sp. ALI-76-A TaxID=3025736 RepID=UPI00256F3715|nr:ADP-ribosylglycohydrolase family protein [Streptomyces sp. ALI-76-A]MDL5200694.1 ADP-ribosylglycohydrolase family protein [Streptomyces sp. ALI-76-A]
MTTILTKRAATGALVGLALGDALGYPTEFDDVPSILAAYGPWRAMELPTPAIVTDDTQMTLALARGLRTAMDRGVLGPEGMAEAVRREFIAWNRSPENNRAPGTTCLTACALLERADRPWQDASRTGSKGCGANMRVAPVGLVPGLSEEQRAGAAQLQAALTHGHPTALAASDLTAHAVRLLAQGAEPAALVGLLREYAHENRSHYHRRWLGDLWTRSQDPSPEHFMARGWDECLEALDRLRDALRAPSPETDPCLATGAGWIAEEALATGLLCFLLFADEPVTALRRAACSSGDSDSIACLAGAFAGAHLGAEVWPAQWADRIEYQSELATLGALWDA